MPVRVVGHVYVWDLTDDPSRADVVAAAGVQEVAIAATYHAVRAVSWQPDGSVRLVQEDRSACHLEVVDANPLLPGPPRAVPGGMFPRAVRRAEGAGLVARAWVPVTHTDGLPLGPGSVVDLWGGRSSFARCPNDPQVRAAGRLVVDEVVRQTGVTRFLLEAVGSLGFRHLTAHDKTGVAALGAWRETLLSLCFCPACTAEAEAVDVDLASARQILQDAFRRDRPDGAEETVTTLLRLRRSAAARLLDEVGAPVEGVALDLTVAASARLDALGPFTPVDGPPPGVGLLAQLDADGGAGWRDLDAWSSSDARLAGSIELGSRARPLADLLVASAPPSNALLRRLDELYLYHLGARPAQSYAELRIPEALHLLTHDHESDTHA